MLRVKIRISLIFSLIFLFYCQPSYSQTAEPVPGNQDELKSINEELAKLDAQKLALIERIISVNNPEIVQKLYDFFVVHDYVLSEYMDQKSSTDLLRLGMIGMVNGLDPNSNLFLDEDAELINRMISGEESFVGIGIVMMNLHRNTIITEVLENSPAEVAGLWPGDIISKVNGESVFGLSVEKVAGLIKKGGEGTTVVLEIKSARFQKPKPVSLVKRQVVDKSVSYKELKGGIVYIKVRSFLPETSEEFRNALKSSIGKKALIIDLRNNSGGSLTAVNEMIGFFIGQNKTFITMKGQNFDQDVFTSTDALPGLPKKIVVLINNFSASASEIMAGNLKHYKIATLVGVRTFGKATAQNPNTLDGRQLNDSRFIINLTVARFYTPDGSDITKNGIQPDMEIEQPEDFKPFEYLTKRDLQFQEALKIFKRK